MRRKILNFVILIFMICTITAGCSQKSETPNENTDTEVSHKTSSEPSDENSSELDAAEEESQPDESSEVESADLTDPFSKGEELAAAGNFYESIKYFESAVSLDDSFVNNTRLLNSYIKSNRLIKAQNLALKMKEKFDQSFISKFALSHTYKMLGEPKKGADILEALLEDAEIKNSMAYKLRYTLMLTLADLYLNYLGDADNALKNLNKYDYQGNNQDTTARTLRKNIIEKQKIPGDAEYLKQLFSKNYMYEANLDAFTNLTGDLSDDQVYQLFQSVRKKDDPFTFVIQGAKYDNMKKTKNEFIYKNLANNIHYVSIKSFTSTSNHQFINAVDTIEFPEDSTLIIDLRDNSGGSTAAASSILDNLIGTADLYKEEAHGKTIKVQKSDSFSISFKEIYVLVNGKSASASEILTLSLKSHLDNVTIVGEKTFGKGVGQRVFTDYEKKRIYVISSFKWNVGGRNINGVGIIPDVPVKDDEIYKYMTDLLDLGKF